jgi:hypothetical protein
MPATSAADDISTIRGGPRGALSGFERFGLCSHSVFRVPVRLGLKARQIGIDLVPAPTTAREDYDLRNDTIGIVKRTHRYRHESRHPRVSAEQSASADWAERPCSDALGLRLQIVLGHSAVNRDIVRRKHRTSGVTCAALPLTVGAVAVRDDDRLALDRVGNSTAKALSGSHGYSYHAFALRHLENWARWEQGADDISTIENSHRAAFRRRRYPCVEVPRASDMTVLTVSKNTSSCLGTRPMRDRRKLVLSNEVFFAASTGCFPLDHGPTDHGGPQLHVDWLHVPGPPLST